DEHDLTAIAPSERAGGQAVLGSYCVGGACGDGLQRAVHVDLEWDHRSNDDSIPRQQFDLEEARREQTGPRISRVERKRARTGAVERCALVDRRRWLSAYDEHRSCEQPCKSQLPSA